MHWGVRNGPPYPLNETGKKLKSQKDQVDTTENNNRRGLTDKQRRIIKYGAIAVGTGLAVYGATKVRKPSYSSVRDVTLLLDSPGVGDAKLLTDSVSKVGTVSDEYKELAKANGFKIHDKIPSISEAARNANPGGERGHCAHDVVSYFANRKGLDVRSKDYPVDGGYTAKEMGLYIKGQIGGMRSISPGSADSIKTQLERHILETCDHTDGAIGSISFHSPSVGGHIMAWEYRDGVVEIIETTTGRANYQNTFYGILSKNRTAYDFSKFDIYSYHKAHLNSRPTIRKALESK